MQTHEENCPDPHERLGTHVTCPEALTEREGRLLLSISDLHSRVTTLFAWGVSHEAATDLMKEAFRIFLEENKTREMKRKPPRFAGGSHGKRATNAVQSSAEEAEE